MTTTTQNIPAALRRWRKRHGLTQAAAAARLGTNTKAVQNWEQGASRPRGLALSSLLAALKS
jgi:DNA-binding transcriptional regulator YiaG